MFGSAQLLQHVDLSLQRKLNEKIFYNYGRNEIIKIGELKLSIIVCGRRLKIRRELKFYEA
jgi:hypothetical protein